MAIQRLSAALAREGMAPLAGCTPEGLARETLANAAQWSFLAKVDALKSRPALVVTSDDGLAPANDAFAAALRAEGDSRVTTLHCRPITLTQTSARSFRMRWFSGWLRCRRRNQLGSGGPGTQSRLTRKSYRRIALPVIGLIGLARYLSTFKCSRPQTPNSAITSPCSSPAKPLHPKQARHRPPVRRARCAACLLNRGWGRYRLPFRAW